MRIGKLRHRIQLQSPSAGPPDSTGQPTSVYATYATIWAAIRTLSGAERIAAEQVSATLSHEITIRYNPDFTVKPDHRILFGSRVFDIKDARNFDERNIEVRMRCTEVIA